MCRTEHQHSSRAVFPHVQAVLAKCVAKMLAGALQPPCALLLCHDLCHNLHLLLSQREAFAAPDLLAVLGRRMGALLWCYGTGALFAKPNGC